MFKKILICQCKREFSMDLGQIIENFCIIGKQSFVSIEQVFQDYLRAEVNIL